MALITSANDMTGSSPLEALLLIGRFTDDDDVGRIDSEQDAAANPAIAFRLQFTRPVGRVAELGSLAVSMSLALPSEVVASQDQLNRFCSSQGAPGVVLQSEADIQRAKEGL